MTTKREIPPTGILQEWVAKLGLRHQGCLLTAIRGCDTAPKEDVSKCFTRAIRGAILNTHCENPEDAASFIEQCSPNEIIERGTAFLKNCDQYPHHFVMHIIHVCEVIGYNHPLNIANAFEQVYMLACDRLHMEPEPQYKLDRRLDAKESVFSTLQ